MAMKPRGMWGAARLETCGMNEPDLGPDHLSTGTVELARADMAGFGEFLKARVLAGKTHAGVGAAVVTRVNEDE